MAGARIRGISKMLHRFYSRETANPSVVKGLRVVIKKRQFFCCCCLFPSFWSLGGGRGGEAGVATPVCSDGADFLQPVLASTCPEAYMNIDLRGRWLEREGRGAASGRFPACTDPPAQKPGLDSVSRHQ